MINLIAIVLLIIIGVVIAKKSQTDWEFVGIVIAGLNIILLFIHVSTWAFVPVSFDRFVAKHNQLQIDLDNSRNSDDSYERVAILQVITRHNQVIAENKQLNKNWFYDQYIDDRVDSLKTIE